MDARPASGTAEAMAEAIVVCVSVPAFGGRRGTRAPRTEVSAFDPIVPKGVDRVREARRHCGSRMAVLSIRPEKRARKDAVPARDAPPRRARDDGRSIVDRKPRT
jgi:hypothetical protein